MEDEGAALATVQATTDAVTSHILAMKQANLRVFIYQLPIRGELGKDSMFFSNY
jgi:hypothetical protein